MNEYEAVQALKSGDMSGFELLFNTYAKQGIRTAYLITSNRQTAEDILQETFIQCFTHIHTLKDNSAFRPWFYKILTRLAYKEALKAKKQIPVEDIYDKAEQAVYDRHPTDSDNIYAYVCKLKPKHKTTVVLYYYNDMSIKDISRIMHCPQGTVKSRLNAAKATLKKILEKEEFL